MQTFIKSFIMRMLQWVYPLVKKIFPFQVFAYLCVGAANTLFNIGLFTLFYLLLSQAGGGFAGSLAVSGFAVELATVFSFLLTVPTGFWLNKNIAFTQASNARGEKAKQFGKYFLVAVQGQFTDYLITKSLIIFAKVNPTLAYVLSTVIMLMLTFILQKYFTFKTKVAA